MEELLPVASRFKELFGDIWSSLTDLEIMVDFIEVPDDGNMERIRNELAAARVRHRTSL